MKSVKKTSKSTKPKSVLTRIYSDAVSEEIVQGLSVVKYQFLSHAIKEVLGSWNWRLDIILDGEPTIYISVFDNRKKPVYIKLKKPEVLDFIAKKCDISNFKIVMKRPSDEQRIAKYRNSKS